MRRKRSQPSFAPTQLQLEAADHYAALLESPRRWVHRRVESVSFIDDSTVRRRVSIDLSVPKGLKLVPIATLTKDLLVDLDTHDETGRGLPVATRIQNSEVAWMILYSRARTVLARGGLAVSHELSNALRAIAVKDADGALNELTTLLNSDSIAAKAVVDDDVFWRLANRLAQEFILLVHVEPSQLSRRLLKFSYVENLEEPSLIAGTLAVLGVRQSSLVFDVPGVSRATSFHFESDLPDELELREAALLVEEEDDFYVGKATLRGSRGHLYFSSPIGLSADGSVILFFARHRTGFVRIAWASALFTALTLAWFGMHVDDLRADDSGATTILVAIPGLLSLLASRQGEHRLASRLFFGSRVLVGICGLLAYAAAATLAVELDNVTFRAIWTDIVVLSWVCFALLSLGLFRLDWIIDRLWVIAYEGAEHWRMRRERRNGQVDT